MAKINTIKFTDIKARDEAAKETVESEISDLELRVARKIELSVDDKRELARLKALRALGDSKYYDPLFVSVRAELNSAVTGLRQVEIDHKNGGNLTFGNVDAEGDKDNETARTALILGLLQLNRAPLPKIKVTAAGGDVTIDEDDPNAPKFREALFQAIGKAAGQVELAKKVLELLQSAVAVGTSRSVSSLDYARVYTKLVADGITEKDANLKRRVEDALDQVQEIGEEPPLHELDINLPDLEAFAPIELEANHCKLFGSFIFASAFEELRAFQVVDTLIDMSQRGTISLIKGPAGTQLYHYWRDAPNRMSESERQTFYAMTLGLPTGQPGVAVNTDFQDLWLRFVSSVSTLIRENRMDQLLRSAVPVAINQQHVKKAARDLAINMSAHGYGMVFYAAADLQKQINEMITLLQDKELQAAFGARDMWGVIDQVAQTELGGARNSSKYRMLATSGAIITSWMAKNVNRLRDPTLPMVDLDAVRNPPSRLSGQTAVSAPTDYDLVNACDMWLADSAMGDERIEQMSQPRDSPQQTSRPIQIPSIARDLLEGTGLGLGMSVGMGVPAGRSGRTNGAKSPYTGY